MPVVLTMRDLLDEIAVRDEEESGIVDLLLLFPPAELRLEDCLSVAGSVDWTLVSRILPGDARWRFELERAVISSWKRQQQDALDDRLGTTQARAEHREAIGNAERSYAETVGDKYLASKTSREARSIYIEAVREAAEARRRAKIEANRVLEEKLTVSKVIWLRETAEISAEVDRRLATAWFNAAENSKKEET